MWGSTSLGRGAAFSEFKEQFHSGKTHGCQWSNVTDGTLSSKSWYFMCVTGMEPAGSPDCPSSGVALKWILTSVSNALSETVGRVV